MNRKDHRTICADVRDPLFAGKDKKKKQKKSKKIPTEETKIQNFHSDSIILFYQFFLFVKQIIKPEACNIQIVWRVEIGCVCVCLVQLIRSGVARTILPF